MYKVVILTPTYNRVNTLPRLYESLKSQNNKNFEWLIIDDGSTDRTSSYVNQIIKENILEIKYIFQNNGGKSRALNLGFSIVEDASVFVIVDSDDFLLPTAIDTIFEYMTRYSDNSEVGAFFFHYNTPDGKLLKPNGNIIDRDYTMTRYEYDSTFGKHDGCICYLKRVTEKYRYPEFEGEKYVAPTVIQMEMADEFKIVFSPIVIGVAEYQEGGLTHSGRQLRINNPLGMIYYSGLQQSRLSPLKIRIKNSIGAQAYRFFSKKDKESLLNLGLSNYFQSWAYIPGLILKLYWQLKYKKKGDIDV